ncbi:MAG: tyrosine-type recombinase/integrase [Defluviitaleaceae bacterium]|nr:tyrosine-type recombinase/integrase [Defluviitaleaceae bacterium]MCL2275464.1 tyrosine-type recombinase/integrase [Defluviitaleaceae bacterium]
MATYHEQKKAQDIQRLREILAELPPFLGLYFSSMSDQTSSLTRVGYAYDLRIFFNYLCEEILDNRPLREIVVEDLKAVESEHLQGFMEYLTYYFPAGENEDALQNAALGKSRKLAAVRGLFRYLYMQKKLPANPAELVSFPKINNKVITTLETDEIAKLLDEVDGGEKLTPRQKVFHERTKLRDAAIITLLLGTGMRVSECVGIDLHHIDFEIGGIKVTRKGGDEMVLYFGEEVATALEKYLALREEIITLDGHENALFLSLQNRRITDRAIQNMVKKYAQLVTRLKNISPHKLRSTFGTQLYAETGDIYLVANVLGHADVNTTRKHYAKMDENYRRRAANAVRLRE